MMALRAIAFGAAILSVAHQAKADIALAVGITSNPREGIAQGSSRNATTDAEARADAMRACRRYKEAPKAALACRMISSAKTGCVAFAFDPKSDSSGMGWALSENKEAAERRALANCRTAAPKGREQFCAIETAATKCEGDP